MMAAVRGLGLGRATSLSLTLYRLWRVEGLSLPSFFQSRSYADNVSGSHITAWEKRLLVWAKMYPSVEQVPEEVSKTQMQKAKEWFRIRSANAMVIIFLVGCYFSMKWGRADVESGDSMHKRGLQYEAEQRQIGAEKRAKEATSAAAAQS